MRKIFLSYSHRDDLPFGPRDMRWVETFEKALRETLGQRVGPGRVDLWRDKRRLGEGTLFDREIQIQLDAADVLITVLSQHYLSSDYCRQEFRRFGEQRLDNGGLHIETQSRILKVYRAALDRADLRRFAELPELISEIDGSTGYDFFCTDENGQDRDALLDPRGIELVWQKADDLAKTIKRIIEMSGEAASAAVAAPPPGPARIVYLARTATDLRDARDAVRRELEDRGCIVLPTGEPAEALDTYSEAVRADLGRASMSLHLLGQRFGATLEGSTDSGVAVQAALALEVERKPFVSLFWSPQDLPKIEPAMQALVEHIAGLSIDAARAEYVRGPLDQLKALLLDRLTPKSVAAPQAAPIPASAGHSIYLVCDGADREATKPLKEALNAQGFEVTRPLLEGSPEEMLEDHKTYLAGCDVVAIVWGKARESWVRSKLRDVQQAPGWGRKKPFSARFVLVGPPESPAKADFDAPVGVVVLPAAELPAALLPKLQ